MESALMHLHKKTVCLAALSLSFAFPATAHKVDRSPAPQSGETYQTADGKTVIHAQIGNGVYACLIDAAEPRTIIAEDIYDDQKRRLHLDRLSWRQREAAGLPQRLYERYVDVLPVNIGAQSFSLNNAIVSDHDEGSGLCLGVHASSDYGNIRRSACGFGLSARVTFKRTQSHWCILGQDAAAYLPNHTPALIQPQAAQKAQTIHREETASR